MLDASSPNQTFWLGPPPKHACPGWFTPHPSTIGPNQLPANRPPQQSRRHALAAVSSCNRFCLQCANGRVDSTGRDKIALAAKASEADANAWIEHSPWCFRPRPEVVKPCGLAAAQRPGPRKLRCQCIEQAFQTLIMMKLIKRVYKCGIAIMSLKRSPGALAHLFEGGIVILGHVLLRS